MSSEAELQVEVVIKEANAVVILVVGVRKETLTLPSGEFQHAQQFMG